MRPATSRDLDGLEETRREMRKRGPKWDWEFAAAYPGRAFVLEEGEDFERGKADLPRLSARKWAKRQGLRVSSEYDRLNRRLFVTFHAVPKQPKFMKCVLSPGAWIDCASIERERATRMAYKHKMRPEFKGKKVRFLFPEREPASVLGVAGGDGV